MALTALLDAGQRGARLGGSFLLRSSVALAHAQFDLPDGQDFGYHHSPMEPVAVAIA
jgi:hypothetical protein